jgi:hypothetical protein
VRISDARYSRDLRRYQFAWRLIRHEVRTRTIQRWTGLSMNRIRTLYDAYAAGTSESARSPLRGKAPYTVGFFWRSAHVKCEAAVLAGFLKVFEVCPAEPAENAHEHLAGLARGERLLRVYVEFKAYLPSTLITLEHAMLLLTELTRGVEIELAACSGCYVLILVDRLAIGPRRCAYCAYEARAGLPYAVLKTATAGRSAAIESGDTTMEGSQGTLF